MTGQRAMPRYPVYVPSKGRADYCLTGRSLLHDGVPFSLVVEPPEIEEYEKEWKGAQGVTILEVPSIDKGAVPVRNWIKDHALASGAERHWQVDDNIRHWGRRYKGKRLRCDAGIALRVCEDFTDRYSNVGVSGLEYYMFVPDHHKIGPVVVNGRVYSCCLYRSDLPYKFRGPTNEDTDMCLQVLSGGLCTILLRTFLVQKLRTMVAKGGNTEKHYKNKDGRLIMANTLARRWPGVVSVDRRWDRPQHVVKGQWKHFDTKLLFKPGIDPNNLPPTEYGMELRQIAPEIKSDYVRSLVETWKEERKDDLSPGE